jgi:hypothetical protein
MKVKTQKERAKTKLGKYVALKFPYLKKSTFLRILKFQQILSRMNSGK